MFHLFYCHFPKLNKQSQSQKNVVDLNLTLTIESASTNLNENGTPALDNSEIAFQDHRSRINNEGNMWAIVDVYSRGGCYSIGTVIQLGRRRFSLVDIERAAIKRVGGDRSAYIPCVGVRLKSSYGMGSIIQDTHIDEIYDSEYSIRSIQDPSMALQEFDFEKFVEEARLNALT